MLEERSPSACEARRVPFSCHSSPPLREPSELGDERREPSPRSHCQPSAGASVNDQPELWKGSGEPERQASPGTGQQVWGRLDSNQRPPDYESVRARIALPGGSCDSPAQGAFSGGQRWTRTDSVSLVGLHVCCTHGPLTPAARLEARSTATLEFPAEKLGFASRLGGVSSRRHKRRSIRRGQPTPTSSEHS